MKLLAKVNAIFDRVLGGLFYMVCVLTAFLWAIVCLEVFMRYFLNRPQMWVLETSGYIMLHMIILGAAWLLKEEGHVRMELVLSRLNPRSQLLLNVATSILGVALCLVLVWYGTQSTWFHYEKGILAISAMRPLKWPFLVVIPFGSFLLFIQFVRRTHGYWGKLRSVAK